MHRRMKEHIICQQKGYSCDCICILLALLIVWYTTISSCNKRLSYLTTSFYFLTSTCFISFTPFDPILKEFAFADKMAIKLD